MKRRNFIQAAGLLAAVPAVKAIAAGTETHSDVKQIYEYRVYTLTGNNTQALDAYFKDCLIPAYSRKNIKVGAFTNYKKEGDELRCLLFVYPNINSYLKAQKEIWDDAAFRKDAQPFFDASAVTPAFTKFDTYLAEAFDLIPNLLMPDKNRTLLEMRIYQSPNEEANKRKVKMFNVDEIPLFDKVGVNTVCYGDVIAGPGMASLFYLTWYKDEATRAAAWSAFGVHPDWIRMKDLPEYANTATNNTSLLLSPMPYSQI
jgi:NIPSNAP.